jgi:uncharacterized iron-regulated membrane protein
MHTIILKLHLWVAFVAAAFVIILGVTGSLMAFEDQLDRVTHPHTSYVTPQAYALPLVELGAAVQKAFPKDRIVTFALSTDPAVSYLVGTTNNAVAINQYTGEILGLRNDTPLMAYVHQFHLRLLAGKTGNWIVSWMGVAMLFLLITGLYLWWPQKRATIKWDATSWRFWFDVHSATGIFTFVFLFLLTVTGVVIGFEEITTPMFHKMAGSQPVKQDFKAAPHAPDAKPITPDQALDVARAAIPGATPMIVSLPGARGLYRIALRFPEDLTPGGRSRVVLDAYTGAVLQAESSRTTASGTRMVNLNRAMHTGDIFGMPSKAVVSLASLFAVLQVASGLVMWWKK